ncbi:hypothetical protein JRO89_XS10G0205500 [Xanthoceras sorbifolium]|uniref:Uncharacterized protein n=1 Tax=Xanthoceras sorbifolium TaxID=99658 RepID=A0ABQ8HJU5_9ROSI|nr:hypothetical protein JRO89_XS10G0205500 [Xanthoceras sorbifolium]
MQIGASRGKTHNRCIMGSKTRLKDVSNGLTASKELVKVLNRIWGAQEQHLSSKSLFSALKSELDRAHIQMKESLLKATKELESEKRAKEILEQVCDELARGVGELKRQSVEVMEEVEKEREMLQLADVLREERVQMKLSEAKYHFEETNAAVETPRNELEAYLRTKKGEENGEMSPSFDRIKDLGVQ